MLCSCVVYWWDCSGEKDHYFVDMADDVVRGSVVSHEVVLVHVDVTSVEML